MGSISRMERCARLGQTLSPLVEKYGGFRSGDRLTVRRAGAGSDAGGPLVFILSALHEPSGEVFEFRFAENIFDPDFTDRADLLQALADNLPNASREEIETAVKTARLFPKDQRGVGPEILGDEPLKPPAPPDGQEPAKYDSGDAADKAAVMGNKVRDAAVETGVFVTSYMDDLIGLLEQAVTEYLQDMAEPEPD